MRLEKINSKNVWEIIKLQVNDNQKNFVASNVVSIVEAYVTMIEEKNVFTFGLYDNEKPIGFIMIGYGIEEEWMKSSNIDINSYSLWRLMIDKQYQGKGYGKQAIKLALDFIKTFPCGNAKYCFLSYEPENTHAKKLYESFGFIETEYRDEEEIVAILNL